MSSGGQTNSGYNWNTPSQGAFNIAQPQNNMQQNSAQNFAPPGGYYPQNYSFAGMSAPQVQQRQYAPINFNTFNAPAPQNTPQAFTQNQINQTAGLPATPVAQPSIPGLNASVPSATTTDSSPIPPPAQQSSIPPGAIPMPNLGPNAYRVGAHVYF